ncbi:MAG: DUF3073 domain-containing protein [Pseudonocardiaceae bacterium]
MGRGRAKAKQTKVARELKYSSPTTDLEALQRELSGDPSPRNESPRGDRHRSDEDRLRDSYDDEYDEYHRR